MKSHVNLYDVHDNKRNTPHRKPYRKSCAEYHRILQEKNIDATILSLKNIDVLHRTPEF